ncbi:MAG: hypothetical protein OXN97_15160 [Bryobacterales bacterium]|nr:hypothetical protein [Bryobacterales bacterium]
MRQSSRYRRKLVSERSRTRNRVRKTLDHDGARLGGAPTDIFGRNGPRILHGLAAERSAAEILWSPAGHLRPKRELLEELLEADLHAHGSRKLPDLPTAHDRVNASIEDVDQRLRDGLAEPEGQARLLERAPGTGQGGACAIPVGPGPDQSASPVG